MIPKDKCKPYGTRKTTLTQFIYLVASLIWIALILLFPLQPRHWLGWLILIVPLVVFYIGFYSADQISIEVEEDMLQFSFVTVGLIVLLTLFSLLNKNYNGDKQLFTGILIVAIVVSLLALVDIWVSKKWFSLVKHIKSVLQTIAVFLLIYGLYIYYYSSKETDNFSKWTPSQMSN